MEPVESTREYKPYGKHNYKSKEKARTESFWLCRSGGVMALLELRRIFTVGSVIKGIH